MVFGGVVFVLRDGWERASYLWWVFEEREDISVVVCCSEGWFVILGEGYCSGFYCFFVSYLGFVVLGRVVGLGEVVLLMGEFVGVRVVY